MDSLSEDNSRCNMNHCYLYLKSLSTQSKVQKFDLQRFEKLIFTSENHLDNQSSTHDCCMILLKFLNENEKQVQLCCDVADAFCLHSTFILKTIQELHSTILNVKHRFPWKILVYSEEASSLLKKHSTVLAAGLVKYVNRCNQVLSFEEFFPFFSNIKRNVYCLLTEVDEIYSLLYITEFFLIFADTQLATTSDIREDSLKTVMSIIILHWNHHISEVRIRIKNLFFNCLKLEFKENMKAAKSQNEFIVAVNTKLFKALAHDIFWNLPYKYFAYLVGLEFISTIYPVSKFLIYVQSDLREGFTRSLQSKRVIGCETDLFKYCTENLSFKEWIEIFEPLIDFSISFNNKVVANNFSRYWLPWILRKFPEYSLNIWQRLPQVSTHRSAAHSKILYTLLKICHSLKIHLPVNIDTPKLLSFLQGCFADSEDARGELFSLMCNLDEQSVVPSKEELQLVIKFLRMNAHSSSTVLRQQVFSSFARLILRLICSSVKVLKNNRSQANSMLEPTLIFLNEFYDYVIVCAQPGCSYQRRITALTLYKILMTYAVSNSGGGIFRNNLTNTTTFVAFAKEKLSWRFTDRLQFEVLFRCLMDPCAEIQNLSFGLLRTYFDLTFVDKSSILLSDTMKILKNNQFYKRQSGVVAVLSIICLKYNTLDEVVKCESFVELFLSTLKSQMKVLEEDTLNAALYEPLDATVKILTYLMTDESSPMFRDISILQIMELIDLLENIVPLLLKALFAENFTVSDYAPSFEESDQALQQIIVKSRINNQLDLRDSREDDFQIKPVYQILLNFIWISLKTCCECESQIVVKRMDILSECVLIRCCNLIVEKLRLCRHKGVIEAAALALSYVVQAVTVRERCEQWLDKVLEEIVYLIENKSGASISRKSGGLSLLVQSIVGSDKRKNKPLLIKCWTEFRRILNVNYDEIKLSISQELPQTHALHLLRVLIADARNSVALTEYLEDIVILCMRTLKAPIWIIRNASLQLFGAILPKIVGQKNFQNDIGVRRAFEEVFVIMPRLLDYILLDLQLSSAHVSHKLISHSNLVPSLVLLSNVQVASVNLMEASLRTKLLHVRTALKVLLGSDLFYVRKIAAKAFISLHSRAEMSVFKIINEDIIHKIKLMEKNENLLHGQLLVLIQALKLHEEVTSFQKYRRNFKVLDGNSIELQGSLISETLLYELGMKKSVSSIDFIRNVLHKLYTHKHLSMGYHDWMYTSLKIILSKNESIQMFNSCLIDADLNLVLGSLKAVDTRLWMNDDKSFIFNNLCSRMENFLRRTDSEHCRIAIVKRIFKVLIRMPRLKMNASQYLIDRNSNLLLQLNRHHYQALNLRVFCLLIAVTRNVKQIYNVLSELQSTLDVTHSNRDLRLNAAEGLLLLSDVKKFQEVELKVVWQMLINLMLDEEEDIRDIGCKCAENFTSRIYGSTDEVMRDLFDVNFLEKWFSSDSCTEILKHQFGSNYMEFVIADVEKFMITCSNTDIVNPFDQGAHNTYKEEFLIIEYSGKALYHFSSGIDHSHLILNLKAENINKMLKNCIKILENKLFVTGKQYEIVLRCYYIFLIILKSVETDSNESGNNHLYVTIVDWCLNFEKTFYLQNDYYESNKSINSSIFKSVIRM